MKRTRSGKQNPCPVCQNTHGCAVQIETQLIECLRSTNSFDAPPGYRFLKLLRNDMGGLLIADDGCNDRIEEQGREWKQKQESRKQKQQADEKQHFSKLLSVDERDRSIRKIHHQLGLATRHRQNLRDRGLSDEQISAGLFFSISPWQGVKDINPNLAGVNSNGNKLLIPKSGFACPVWDNTGRVVGFQTRFDDSQDGTTYKWATSRHNEKQPNGATPHLPNGELPISCCRPAGKTELDSIGLAEGLLKPYIAAQVLGQILIGAAGGQFASSPQQLKAYLETLSVELETKTVDLYPDGGAVGNPHIMRNYKAAIALVQEWGYTVRIAWWGQFTKDQPDIDELDSDAIAEIQYISVDKFFEIAHRCSSQSNELTLEPEVIIDSQFIGSALLDLMEKHNFQGVYGVKAAQGRGKTIAAALVAHHIQATGGKMSTFSLRTFLGRALCEELGIFYAAEKPHESLSQDEKRFGIGLCGDSLWKHPVDYFTGQIILLDEFVQLLKHLLFSDTIRSKGKFYAIIAKFRAIVGHVIATGGAVICMDADLDDLGLNYLLDIVSTAGLKTDLHILVNSYKRTGKIKAYLYEDVKQWKAAIAELVPHNKTFLASDSKALANDVANLVNARESNIKSIIIDADTTGTKGHPANSFSTNFRRKVKGYHLVAASPTLCTGVSDDSGHFDIVAGSFRGMLPASDVVQQLSRVRYPVDRHLFIEQGTTAPNPSNGLFGNGSDNPNEIKRWYEANFDQIVGFIPANDPLTGQWQCDSPEFRLACQYAAKHNRSIKNLRADTIARLEAVGYEVEIVSGIKASKAEIKQAIAAVTEAKKTGDETAVATAQQKVEKLQAEIKVREEVVRAVVEQAKEVKQQVQTAKFEATATAEDISEIEAERLDRTPLKTITEQRALDKHTFKQVFGGVEPTVTMLEKAKSGWHSKIRRHYLIQVPFEEVAIKERDRIQRHIDKASVSGQAIYLPHVTYNSQVSEINALHKLGVDSNGFLSPERGEIRESDADVRRLLVETKNYRARFKEVLGLTFEPDDKLTGIKVLSQILRAKLDISLEKTKKEGGKGKQTRVYQVVIPDDGRKSVFEGWVEEVSRKNVSNSDTVVTQFLYREESDSVTTKNVSNSDTVVTQFLYKEESSHATTDVKVRLSPIGKRCKIQQIVGTTFDPRVEWVAGVLISEPNYPASTNWIFELDDSRKRIAVAGFDEWVIHDGLHPLVAA